jgi:multidrug efflux pump subunit AcrA (membrane-fusion protein)
VGKLKPVPVETGITDNALTEIVSGDLKPGDRVVTRDRRANGTLARAAAISGCG